MLTKSKWINILCSLIIGLIFGLTLLLVAILASGILSSNKTLLTVYTDSNQKVYDGVPLTDHDWTLEGFLKDGHQAKAVYKGSRTEAGESENSIELIITDQTGRNVTNDYKIQYEFGILTVEPRKLVIIGSTDGLQDGTLSQSSYQISPDCDGLVIGHREKISLTAGIASVTISDLSGKDFTRNYSIMFQVDGATFFPSDSNQKVTLFKVYSDVDDTVYLKMRSYGDYRGGENWAAAPIYENLIDGTFSASYLTSFAIQSMGFSSTNLKIQSLCGYYALPYYMLDGDYQIQTSDSSYSGSTSAEYSVNYFSYSDEVQPLKGVLAIFEKDYRNFVYENYLNLDETSRTYMEGLMEKQGFSKSDPDVIKKVASYIQNAAVYNLDYPKSLETEENVAIAFLETYKEGVCRHYSISAVLLFRALGFPARYCVGALAFTEAGQWAEVSSDLAHAWVEVYLDGIGWINVEVTGGGVSEGGGGGGNGGGNGGSGGEGVGKGIYVKPKTSVYRYDGNVHFALQEVSGLDDILKNGYYYTAVVSGERTEAGKTATVIESLQIFDRDGNDVTDQYQLNFDSGVLQVYYEEFQFTSTSAEQIYSGEPNDMIPDVRYDQAMLKKYKLEVQILPSQNSALGVGTHLNKFSIKLYQDGQDVTDFYYVKKSYGNLSVKPREITLKAGDAQKVYDGTELICHEYSITEGSLGKGQIIGDDIVYTGSQINIGRSDNEITYVCIYDADGNNVTKNYSITLVTGKLRVTR